MVTLSARYIELYERITGENFVFHDEDSSAAPAVDPLTKQVIKVTRHDRLVANLRKAGLLRFTKKAALIMGSDVDLPWATTITKSLEKYGLSFEIHQASAHKSPLKGKLFIITSPKRIHFFRAVLSILQRYEADRVSHGGALVYITIAGRSNALSGFVAANTTYAHPFFSIENGV